MATIKYKDADGNLITVGAGLHTHSPSSIGAAEAEHPHDVATADNDGFLSSEDKTKLDNLNDTVFNNTTGLVDLVGGSPVAEQISSAIANKVEGVPGKGLSTEDYTTAEKTKLANIDPYANNYELPVAGKDELGGVKTTSTVTSSSGYTACPIISGVPYYKDTNTKNTAGASNTSNKIYLVGATSQSTSPTTYSHDTVYVGTDGCLYSGGVKVSDINHSHTVDDALSQTSTNPVQNKVVYAIDNKIGPEPVSEQISSAITSATTTIGGAANKYTDNKIAALINGAPSTLDTLGEIATAMANNADVVAALDKAIGQKADGEHKHVIEDITDLSNALAGKVSTARTVNGKALSANISLTAADVGAATSGHAHEGLYYTKNEVDSEFDRLVGGEAVSEQISGHNSIMASQTSAGHMSAVDKTKLDGLKNYTHPSYTAKSAGLYKVTVDSSGHVSGTAAVQKSDITALGIPSSDTVYTHPTSAGNKHIPSGGQSGQILRWSSSGTAVWGADNNTTYSNATTSTAGLMSATDKKNLDNVVTQLGGYTIVVKRDPNYVPPSSTPNTTITIVLPS